MKVTTVRFGTDLWALLEREASLVGVSVSQYLREAALARATAAAVARGEGPFEVLAGALRESAEGGSEEQRRAAERALGALARLAATERHETSEALRNQSRQAQRVSERRRARAAELAQDAADALSSDED